MIPAQVSKSGKPSSVVHLRIGELMILATMSDLLHETGVHTGDLYVRGVRFSPDGKLLATGAEDRQIRVRRFP